MSWFSFLDNTGEATPSTVSPPLRRVINIDDLENPIFAEEIIAVKLNGKKVNERLSSSLNTVEDDDSYIVIYQDSADENFFVPVKSRVENDVLYFKAEEDISSSIENSRYYAIYYGLNNLKYLDFIDDNVYQQVGEIGLSSVEEGDYFDLMSSDTSLSLYEATESSLKSFQLALYDKGNSWLDGRSTAVGAKAFGVFDGPNFNVIGSKGPDLGKFRIKINKVLEDNTFSKTIAINWQEVDCFSRDSLSNQILFSTTNVLEYERYFFEIETLSVKNSSSTSNAIEISSYKFTPNYKITIETEELNPSIPFIRIGGIR